MFRLISSLLISSHLLNLSVFGSSGPEPPPAPELLQLEVGGSSWVVLQCRAPKGHGGRLFRLYHVQTQVDSARFLSDHAHAEFRVKNVTQGSRNIYCCQYENSIMSRYTSPRAPTLVLPVPHLTRGVGQVLVCTGSPLYPGAHFSLFHQGPAPGHAPLTQHLSTTQHSAHFTVPGGLGGGAYECQYRVQLGKEWVHSERSAPLVPLVPLVPSPPTKDKGKVPPDLPLVAGSVSAALLFLLVLVLMGVGLHKYAKAAAEKRRQRDQDQFWQKVHCRDHIINLTLQRVDAPRKDIREEPVYDHPLTTFTQPTHTY